MQPRTSIDDLDLTGQELSEEHLRLVSGGRAPGLCLTYVDSTRPILDFDI